MLLVLATLALVSTAEAAGCPGASGTCPYQGFKEIGLGGRSDIGHATDVAVDSGGNVYVSTQGVGGVRSGILQYDSAGSFVRQIAGTFRGTGGQFVNSELIEYPAGVAVDGSGNVYLTDGGFRTVTEFAGASASTPLVKAHFSDPNTQDFSSNWADAAVDSAGHVFVADRGGNKVMEFDSSTSATPGKLLQTWTTGYGGTTLTSPDRIAVQPATASHPELVDVSCQCGGFSSVIEQLKLDGTAYGPPLGTAGNYGDPGNFSSVSGLAVGPGDVLYVSTGLDVQAHKPDGSWVKFSVQGDNNGAYEGQGLAVGGSTLYLVTNNIGVQRYNVSGCASGGTCGTYQSSFGASQTGELESPYAGAVAPDGTLYVVNSGQGRISQFKPNGTPEADFTSANGSPIGSGGSVAVDGSAAHNVWIGQPNSSSVLELSPSGTEINSFSTSPTTDGLAADATNVYTEGQVYDSVAGAYNPVVQAYPLAGGAATWSHTFGGNTNTSTTAVLAIAADNAAASDKDVYVLLRKGAANSQNSYDYTYQVQALKVSDGTADGAAWTIAAPNNPGAVYGLAVSGTAVYADVEDSSSGQQIKKFKAADGTVLLSGFGASDGSQDSLECPGTLDQPLALAAGGPNAGVYAIDSGRGAVSEFEFSGSDGIPPCGANVPTVAVNAPTVNGTSVTFSGTATVAAGTDPVVHVYAIPSDYATRSFIAPVSGGALTATVQANGSWSVMSTLPAGDYVAEATQREDTIAAGVAPALPVGLTGTSGDQSFSVANPNPVAPAVTTTGASTSGSHDLIVSGSVNPEGEDTHYYVQYGSSLSSMTSFAPSHTGNDAGSGNGDVPVTVDVGSLSLSPATEVCYRLVAYNATGSTNGSDVNGGSGICVPTVDYVDPQPGLGQLTLKGVVSPELSSPAGGEHLTTSDYFQISTASDMSGATTVQTNHPSGLTAPTAVTATATGLTNGHTYYYRLVASSVAGTVYGAIKSAVPSVAPTVTTGALNISNPGQLDAAGWSLNAKGQSGVSWHFEYTSATNSDGSPNWGQAAKTSSQAFPYSDSSDHQVATGFTFLTGLSASTRYWVRVLASACNGCAVGSDATPATQITADVPVVVTTNATPRPTDILVSGTVGPEELDTHYYVQYGDCGGYGNDPSQCLNHMPTDVPGSGTSANDLPAKDGSGAYDRSIHGVTVDLTGLSSGHLYCMRMYATNSAGTAYGYNNPPYEGKGICAWTVGPPSATTGATFGKSANSLTFTGSVNPGGDIGYWYFAYGTDRNNLNQYVAGSGATSPPGPPLTDSTGAPLINHTDNTVQATASGLTPSQQYCYQLVVQNSQGTARGGVQCDSTNDAPGGGGGGFHVQSGNDPTITLQKNFDEPNTSTWNPSETLSYEAGTQPFIGWGCDAKGNGTVTACTVTALGRDLGLPDWTMSGTPQYGGSWLLPPLGPDASSDGKWPLDCGAGGCSYKLRATVTTSTGATSSTTYNVTVNASPPVSRSGMLKDLNRAYKQLAPVLHDLTKLTTISYRKLEDNGKPVALIGSDGSIVAGDIIAAGSGNVIGAGAGNLIDTSHYQVVDISKVQSLVDKLKGIIAAGAGNIIAAGSGNIIGAGAGNIIAAGAGNIVFRDGQIVGGIIAAGAGNIKFLSPDTIIAAGAGNIIAAGAGNIIAAGSGNIIAAGAGNIIAAGAGNLTAAISVAMLSSSSLVSKVGSMLSAGLIGPGGLGQNQLSGGIVRNAFASAHAKHSAAPLLAAGRVVLAPNVKGLLRIYLTKAGKAKLLKLAKANAVRRKHHQKLHKMSLALVLRDVSLHGGKAQTKTHKFTLAPVAASPKHHKGWK